ncbi:MAG: UbiA prenyltransferase family protein [Deltaproteobacteria bacterium]|nr:UbiA prenyltransferase family protein [Deltaproteobacteria bacterium]
MSATAGANARAPGGELPVWRTCLVHMRLAFSLFLLPVFLLDVCAFVGRLTWPVVVLGVLIHVFLYTGSNAYNSYYDEDEGPIGGLEKPPQVVAALLPFSVGLKVVSVLGSFWVDAWVGVLMLAFALMSAAYSYPGTRWKGRPFASLATVFGGQGLIVGLIAARLGGVPLGAWSVAETGIVLGTSLTILGFYLFSHSYQGDEDRERGDRTFTVVYGAPASVAWGIRLQAAGFGVLFAGLTGSAVVAVVVPIAAALAASAAIPRAQAELLAGDVIATFRRLMKLNWLVSSALNGGALVYLAYHSLG